MSRKLQLLLGLAAAGTIVYAAGIAAQTPSPAPAPAPAVTPAPGAITAKLSAAELAKVKAGEIILKSSASEDTKSGSGFAVGLIRATPEQIWATILDYDKYSEFMTRVKSCKRTLYQGTRVDSDFVLDMGVTNIRYSIIHTIVADKNRLTWVLDNTKPRDYITKTTGYWQFEPLPAGGTLVEYSVEVDIEVPVIGFLVRSLVKTLTNDDLPNVIETLKKRVESGNKWKR